MSTDVRSLQKHGLWVRMLTGQITQAGAAAEAGVDRSVISGLRGAARDGAIAALNAKPAKNPVSTVVSGDEARRLRRRRGPA